jgi:hypothetical protein
MSHLQADGLMISPTGFREEPEKIVRVLSLQRDKVVFYPSYPFNKGVPRPSKKDVA